MLWCAREAPVSQRASHAQHTGNRKLLTYYITVCFEISGGFPKPSLFIFGSGTFVLKALIDTCQETLSKTPNMERNVTLPVLPCLFLCITWKYHFGNQYVWFLLNNLDWLKSLKHQEIRRSDVREPWSNYQLHWGDRRYLVLSNLLQHVGIFKYVYRNGLQP